MGLPTSHPGGRPIDHQTLLSLYDQDVRIQIEYPGMIKETFSGLVRFRRPAPGMSFINYSRIEPAELDRIIQTQVEDLTRRGLRFEWVVCEHDSPPELVPALQAHGFEPDEPGDLMVLDVVRAPTELLAPIAADVRVLTRREEIEDVIRIEEQVWGGNFNWMRERMGASLEIPGYLHLLVAYIEGIPACAGWTYYYPNSRFAGLWGGSTIPAYRKRGLYTAVLAARVQEARRRGIPYLFVEAGPQSRPILAAHGFEYLDTIQSFEYCKGGAA
jgi:GNAT superfamily N-acetyltransferase